MKRLLLITLTLFAHNSFAQGPPQPKVVPEAVLKQIEQDVWRPFIKSYQALDIEAFKAFHAQDIVRVDNQMNNITHGNTYFTDMGKFFGWLDENDRKLGIAFSILSSAVDKEDKTAYQTGYYRISRTEGDETKPQGFGQFNVLLTVVDGQWKIKVDSDKVANISDEEFYAGRYIIEG